MAYRQSYVTNCGLFGQSCSLLFGIAYLCFSFSMCVCVCFILVTIEAVLISEEFGRQSHRHRRQNEFADYGICHVNNDSRSSRTLRNFPAPQLAKPGETRARPWHLPVPQVSRSSSRSLQQKNWNLISLRILLWTRIFALSTRTIHPLHSRSNTMHRKAEDIS